MKAPQKILDFRADAVPFRPAEDVLASLDFDVDLDFGDLDLAGFDTSEGPVSAMEQIPEELSKPRQIIRGGSGCSAQHAVDLADQVCAAGPGVSRAILAGTFVLGDFIAAVCDRLGPARVKISTLSFSAENVDAMWTCFRDGKIEHLDFVTSDFYYSHYRGTLWRMLVTSLPKDKCRYAVAGVHAKVTVIEGREHTCVIEGSANLRSCRNVEQVLISYDDPEAVRFHGKWIDRLVARFGLTWNKMGNRDVWDAITKG